jgi:hypothetical protein
MQQLCYIRGELSHRSGELIAARRYFFLAKTDKEGNNALRWQAEDRLEEIKQEEAQAPAED